jgi:ribonucleotide monophosphatase NagD (HAD superfamily)
MYGKPNILMIDIFCAQAFSKLVNPDTKKFCIPTIFVTNAGNSLRQEKADKLSEWLNIPISEEQVTSLELRKYGK